MSKRTLYTIYRNRDDALIAFELPARAAAAILGIERETFYHLVCNNLQAKNPKYTVIKIFAEDAQKLEEDEE